MRNYARTLQPPSYFQRVESKPLVRPLFTRPFMFMTNQIQNNEFPARLQTVRRQPNHILGIRGLVRLASPAKDRPADFATLRNTMTLATRKEEKVLALGAMGTVPTLESLTFVASFLNQPELAQDAGLAAVLIAEKIGADKSAQVRPVMQRVAKTVTSEKTRARAKKVLEPPQPQEPTVPTTR